MFSAASKLVLLLLGLVVSSTVHAGNVQVSPVRVFIEGANKSALLTVANQGPTAMRIQVDAYRWRESSSGQQQLEPTSDLVVFPSLIEIAPGESRVIRVGTTRATVGREVTYRVIVEEQPNGRAAINGVAIRMRMSVPVFVAEAGGRPLPRVDAATITNSRLSVSVFNDGARHFKPEAIVVTITDSAGKQSHHRIPGWYVLAGQRRDYVLDLPASVCVREVTTRIETTLGDVERTDRMDSSVCAPPLRR